MKTRISRLLARSLCVYTLLPLLAASAATRICSVYVESYSALQKQLFLGAEVFQSPQLGAMPMMLTMSLPGAAQINPDQPVALHIFDIADGKTGFVLEVTPVGTPEAYLQAIIGNEARLTAPVDGVFAFEGGAARVAGNRVQLSTKAADLDACVGKDAAELPPLPAIPGTIRIAASPAALKPLIASFKKTFAAMSQSGIPNAEQTQRSIETVFDFYSMLLGQMEALQLGMVIQREGLAIHTWMTPAKGSEIANLVASVKPVTPEHLAFLESDALFGFAAGSYVLPEALRKQFVDMYTRLVSLSPGTSSVQPADLAAMMDQSMRVLGAPIAFTANLSTNALLVQGVMDVADAEAYLSQQLAMMKTPTFQAMMKQSGMTLSEPVVRTYKTSKIHTFNTVFDEESFKKIMREQLGADADPETVEAAMEAGMGPMRMVMKLFSGYEYAATEKTLAFGMGAPAMVERAIDRSGTPAQPSAEAGRIQHLLAPPAAPCAVGRFSLSGFIKMILTMTDTLPAEDATTLPAGEGAVFAEWIVEGHAQSTLLVPPSEITSMKAMFQAITQAKHDEAEAKELNEEPPTEAAKEATAEADGK